MKWEPESGAGVRVLLVDDDAYHREALREVLETLEFLVVGEAADGAEAIEQAEQTNPHVVLMDLRMPVLGGIESTQAIRRRQPSVQVQYADPHIVSASDLAGAVRFLRDWVRRATQATV